MIGGLVDKNRHKGLTHRQAVEAGVRTARLPIKDHIQLSTRHVLAVNHVVEILVHRACGLDWASALMRVMPERRGAAQIGTSDAPTAGAAEAATERSGAEDEGVAVEVAQRAEEEAGEEGAAEEAKEGEVEEAAGRSG